MPVVPKIINWSDCGWFHPREGLKSKRFQGLGMTVQVAEISPGHSQRPNKHENEQTVLILGGECDFYVDGVPYPMSAGCLMVIPPYAEHYIVVKGDRPCWNLDVLTPKRESSEESRAGTAGPADGRGFTR